MRAAGEMAGRTAEVVVCGAGIAGISAAYHLAVRQGVGGVVLVDERPPLSLTSDKSAECYRNWWPGEAMVGLMNRSIDLLEELAQETGNAFAMNRAGYAYLTARPEQAAAFEASAREISRLGGGPLRIHRGEGGDPPYPEGPGEGLRGAPDGADLVLEAGLIRRRHPFLAGDVTAMLHPRRCGWLAAQQLGMILLERARDRGVRLVRGRVEGVEVAGGRVAAVRLGAGAAAERIATRCFVNAAGPYLRPVGELAGLELPVYNELHGKVTFDDHLGIVPRELPLMIWSDPVLLPWSDEERTELEGDPEMRWLLRELPGGVHFRPEGGRDSRMLLLLWTYDTAPREPAWPPAFDPLYPQVVLRGVARMVPALSPYFERGRRPFVDGGYYCKTRENRPLIGPTPVEGFWVLGALSGYGIMVSQGAADLLAAWITGGELPPYAAAFALSRYDDPDYRRQLAAGEAASGQL